MTFIVLTRKEDLNKIYININAIVYYQNKYISLQGADIVVEETEDEIGSLISIAESEKSNS